MIKDIMCPVCGDELSVVLVNEEEYKIVCDSGSCSFFTMGFFDNS